MHFNRKLAFNKLKKVVSDCLKKGSFFFEVANYIVSYWYDQPVDCEVLVIKLLILNYLSSVSWRCSSGLGIHA